MSGAAPAVVNEDFDRWSDDTPEVNQKDTKEREFDAWSEDSDGVMVDQPVGEEAPEEQELPFFTDTDPDLSHMDLGVSSKSSAPHPGEAKDVKENAQDSTPLMPTAPKVPTPPKAPPPAHLLRRNAAELPLPPPPAMPPLGMQQLRPVVHQVPVVLLPVSAPWSCFVALQHGTEHTKLLATLLMGDVATAQALVQDANSRFKLSHRKHFEEVKKSIGATLKVVLQFVPTDAKDHQVRDHLETYLLSKDRAGVVRVGNRDMYLIPPAKVKDCGLKVVPPAKSIVAAITEKTRSKKAKEKVEKVAKAKKVVEVAEIEMAEAEAEVAEVAEVEAEDDTEDSEEAKTGKDKKEVKEDEMSKEKAEAAVSEETKEEAKKDEKEKVHHSPFESASFQVNPQAPPQAKPRFSRLDVENAAFKIARSRYDRDVPVHREQPPSQPGPPLPPGTWLPFPQLPRWNPYVCPPDVPDVPAERRKKSKKRHKSSKEHRTRARRRAKSKDSESESTPKRSRSRHEEVPVRNPYADPVVTGEAEEAPEEDDPTDAKWKGLLARVEALAEFCRSDGQDT